MGGKLLVMNGLPRLKNNFLFSKKLLARTFDTNYLVVSLTF